MMSDLEKIEAFKEATTAVEKLNAFHGDIALLIYKEGSKDYVTEGHDALGDVIYSKLSKNYFPTIPRAEQLCPELCEKLVSHKQTFPNLANISHDPRRKFLTDVVVVRRRYSLAVTDAQQDHHPEAPSMLLPYHSWT